MAAVWNFSVSSLQRVAIFYLQSAFRVYHWFQMYSNYYVLTRVISRYLFSLPEAISLNEVCGQKK